MVGDSAAASEVVETESFPDTAVFLGNRALQGSSDMANTES